MKDIRLEMLEFGYGDIFLDEYFIPSLDELNGTPLSRPIPPLEELKSQNPWLGGIAGYVASTIFRGEEILHACSQQQKPIRRALDVGCGFGGTLVAMGRRGISATGIELDDNRARASRALLRDQGIEGSVLSMDIYDSGFAELEPFDLIISENVIEHVDDPNMFLQRLSEKLAPGGIMYLEFPNMHAIGSVLADAHFSLPLVTLLPRLQAINAVRSKFGQDAGYDVGEYHPRSFYVNKLKSLGLDILSVRPHHRTVKTLGEFDNMLSEVIKHASDTKNLYPKIEEHERHLLLKRTWSYISDAANARSASVANNEVDNINDYLSGAYIVFASRPL